MANTPLIEIMPGQGLESGLAPSVEPSAGAIWREGSDVWFRPLSITNSLGTELALNVIGRQSQAMTQAFADGETRLYFEDLGNVYKWTGAGSPTLIGDLDDEGSYDLEPFGTWLLATDNVTTPKVWKNDTNGFADIGESEFTRGKIIKKLSNRVLVYNTDVLPAGFHYSSPSDAETWAPTPNNGAGNLPLRDLDSEIIAVADLGPAHAVYTEDRVIIVQYIGEGLRFGAPNPALSGVGAVSKDSVISMRDRNFGLFRNGVFMTDGVDYRILDEPFIRDFLQEEVDWSESDQIAGYHDKRSGLLCWSLPLLTGNPITLTLNQENKFSFMSGSFSCGVPQDIFDTAFVAKSAGIYKAAVTGTRNGDLSLVSQLFDAGNRSRYKAWDYAIFEGRFAGQVRFGFTDTPDMDTVEWTAWDTLSNTVPFTPRESIYIAVEIAGTGAVVITGMKIYGAMAGLVT